MEYKYNNGGRSENTAAPDCVTRALAIVTISSYQVMAQHINKLMTTQGVNVLGREFADAAKAAGLIYFSTPQGGFKVSDLPTDGVYIAHTAGHVSAVVDGGVLDTFDTREEEIRGYWLRRTKAGYNVYKGDARINLYPLDFDTAVSVVGHWHLNYSRRELLTVRPNL